MIVWGADGELSAARTRYSMDRCRLRPIDLGGHKVYVDSASSSAPNQVAQAFGLNVRGFFGLEDGANLLQISKVFGNVLRYHDLIFGTCVKDIQDEKFAVFVPSYDSIFEFMDWDDLLQNEGDCGRIVYSARMNAFKNRLSPEEFFRLYPSTGCPYMHCWDEDKDDLESTCTLCEGYRERSRSRSPRSEYKCSMTQIFPKSEADPAHFSCVACGTFLGLHNPRQYCGKTHCLEF